MEASKHSLELEWRAFQETADPRRQHSSINLTGSRWTAQGISTSPIWETRACEKSASTALIQTVAGGGAFPAANQGQGGPATGAQLMEPRNVTIDAAGFLYISDFGANQVYCVASDGTLTLVAGTGVAGFSGDGASALLGQFNAPAGLAVDSIGALYVADSANNRVRKVFNGVILTVFNTPGPTGVALDSAGTLYVAAQQYFGTLSQQIPGIAPAVDVTVDHSGGVYATSGTFVLEIPAGGMLTTIAGSSASQNFGGDNGPATAAQLYSPSAVARDSSGNWYIADTSNNRIRMVTAAGVISTFVGIGAATQLTAPRGLAFDIFGNLLVADSGNNAVRKITPGGVMTSLPIATQLNNPVGVATDAQGSIYIADSGDNQIVKVTASGETTNLGYDRRASCGSGGSVGQRVCRGCHPSMEHHTGGHRDLYSHGTPLACRHRICVGWQLADRRYRRECNSPVDRVRLAQHHCRNRSSRIFWRRKPSSFRAVERPDRYRRRPERPHLDRRFREQPNPGPDAGRFRYSALAEHYSGQRGELGHWTYRARRNHHGFRLRLRRHPNAAFIRWHCGDTVLHQRNANQRPCAG